MERALCPVLIGREEQLSELEDALLAANRGDGQVVLLAGDAGMGKTRLATELARRAERMGMVVLSGGCSEADLALPYLPFLEAVGNYLASADLDKVRAGLGPMRRELGHLLPQLDPEGELPPPMDPVQGRLRLFEAILALLRMPAAASGLVLVVEDLHWADASTRELIDYLTRRLRSSRILVVGTYRRDELNRKHPLLPMIQGWRRSQAATIVELEPLGPEQMAHMVTAIFDLHEGVREDTRDFLHQRSEGNPFVLEEMLKAAIDRGDIFHTEGGWERRALAEFKLPDSVRDTILLRLDRLGDGEREVLRVASVIGYSFDYATLAEVSGLAPEAVLAAVEACIQQQLLVDVEGHSGRYRFRHALTREAIYNDLILPRREALHSRAADVLAARAGSSSFDLCHHLLEAGRLEEAVPRALEAAAAAEKAHAFAEAAQLYERIRPLVKDPVESALLAGRLGLAHYADADSRAGRAFLEEGIRRLEELDRPLDAARFRVYLGRLIWEDNQPEAANAAYQSALKVLETGGPSVELAMAYMRLAGMHVFAFEEAPAFELAARAIEVAEQVPGSEEVVIWALVYQGFSLISAGKVDEGLRLSDSAWRRGIALGYLYAASVAFYNAAVQRLLVLRVVTDVPAMLEESGPLEGWPGSAPYLILVQRMVAWIQGRYAESIALLDRIIDPESGAPEVNRVRAAVWKAESLATMGRFEEAAASLPRERALEAQEEMSVFFANFGIECAAGRFDSAREAALAMLPTAQEMSAGPRWAVLGALLTVARPEDVPVIRRAADRMRAAQGQNAPISDWAMISVFGRLAFAEGDPAAAVTMLGDAVRVLNEARYWDFAAQPRIWLGEALLAIGDTEAGLALLNAFAEEADERGAVVFRAGAERAAAAHGLSLEPAARPPAPPAADDASPVAPAGPAAAPPPVQPTGERLVSVLFADVRGYTALSRELAPADMVDRLGAFQRWATTEVERHHGVVDKFAGDALMATFNVTGGQVDHAGHALRCAIALRDKAAALGLPLGCGIATGAAVVGALAAGANLSVVGQSTNLASRLQGQAGVGEIVLDAEAYRRTFGWLAERGYEASQEHLELKGIDAPVAAYRVGNRASTRIPADA